MINKYFANGKTLYEVFVKGRNRQGKQVARRRRGITSIKKAKDTEVDLLNEIRGISGQEASWTWRQWHEECLRRMEMTLKSGTVIGYDGGLKKWLSKDWDEKNLSEINKNDIFDLIFNHIEVKDGVTKNIQKVVLKKIRRLLEMAIEDGIIPRNPAVGIKIKTSIAEKKVLNSNETELLLESAKSCNHRFYYHWAFALLTGMRTGEMYALRWPDIDFETTLISVTKQWTSKDGLHQTKSNRNRVVPISPELKKLLAELKRKGPYRERFWQGIKGVRRSRNQESNEPGHEFNDLVLPRLSEWRHGEQAKVLASFCRQLGIEAIKFHDLRATFITNMLAQGVPLVKVMAIVGHTEMSTTNEYLRLAGVDIKTGTTEKLGYALPSQSQGKVIHLFSGGES